ncbi:MAG: transposase [Bacillus sp. (in: firmicutes)]
MTRQRRTFTPEFKLQLVKLYGMGFIFHKEKLNDFIHDIYYC